MTLLAWTRAFFRWLWASKFRFVLSLISSLVFAFLIFPYDDLADLVSSQVATASRGSLFLQFEKLRLSLVPQPGLQLDEVYVEAIAVPGISVRKLTVTPSVSALIAQKPYGAVSAEGILKGNVDIAIGSGGTSERGAELTRLDVEAQSLSLQDIRQIAKLPVLLKGQLDLAGKGEFDLAFTEQPTLDLDVKINRFEMPPSNVQTMLGPLTLPEMKLSGLELKGRLADGRFLIQNARLGGPGDDLQGQIKGSINVTFVSGPAGPMPQFGPYSLELDLQPSASFQSRAGFFLNLLTPYRSGDRYRLKLSGVGFRTPPRMSALR